ncbi:MAG: cardiolipin synthase [Lachnospiraceae bacterium]|nr:cardiolipin synthase [Lachnospiraceae bacterium]
MSEVYPVNVKEKSKSALFGAVFSRTVVTAVLLIVQIVLIVVCFKWLSQYMTYILGGFSILNIILLIYIVNNKSNPAFKLAWVLPLCIFPVTGAIIYLFISFNFGGKKLKNRMIDLEMATEEYNHTEEALAEAIAGENGLSDISYYLDVIAGNPTYINSDVTYYSLGEHKFKDMLLELEKAERFIFFEYFIVDRGIMWDSILEVLERKASEGVEVRVMYDGMCSLILLPYSYPKTLRKMGIKAKMFAPIIPLLSTHQNGRDHRKILVIDGKVAFNGGINISDEYINEKEVFGHWKDTAVRIKGDAVQGYTKMFLQMWNVDEKISEDYDRYLSGIEQAPTKDKGVIIPYGDGPTNDYNIAVNVYLDILYKAKKYVHIMTPYLIIDHELFIALTYAAERGIDVKILLPHIPDKKIPFNIARTYYPQLIKSGVQIYEYTPGFIHAKAFVSDDERAVVGTINLDFRSLYHHFECGTYLYRHEAIRDIELDFVATIAESQKITMTDYNNIPLFTKLNGHVFRMFGSLM